MTATSHYRGNPVTWEDDNQRWVYTDTGEPTPGWGGEKEPCGLCGQPCGRYEWTDDGDIDPCLGYLPGVTNACCGHGNPGEAYVIFENGIALRGFTVEYHDLPLIHLEHFQSQHADGSLYWLFSNEIRMRKQIQRCGHVTINGATQQ